MFRKLRTFLISLTLVLVATIGTAFSVFYFGDISFFASDFDQQLRVDNVKENYTFGRDEELDTEYTIYLFPSSLYSVIYRDYLNKKYDDDSNNDQTAIKPEEAFGYIEASLENGKVVYTAKEIETKGNAYIYNDEINNDEIICNNYYDFVSTLEDENYYIRTSDAKYGYDWWDGQYINTASNYYVSALNGELNASGLGDPDIDLNSKYDANNFKFKNQFRYDRFGAWENLYAAPKSEDGKYVLENNTYEDAGRYLPQKLVVRQSATADYFSTYTMEPITSMGDASKDGWYNIVFSSWTTFKVNDNGVDGLKYELPYTNDENREFCLWSFLSGDITSYFDIMQNLEIYADENNVIRLFPYFSNGKNYEISNPSYGGRDGLKIKYTYNNNTSAEKYFMYNSEALGSNDLSKLGADYNGLTDIRYAILSNIEIDPNLYANITEDTTEDTNKDTTEDTTEGSENFAVQYAKSAGVSAQWEGTWHDYFENKTDHSQKDIVTYLSNKYGSGLYNFYIFVGDSGIENSLGSGKNFDISDIGTKVSNGEDNNLTAFSELRNKKFILIGDTVNLSYDYTTGRWPFEKTYYCTRPIQLYAEKVSEGRLYNDLTNSYANSTELQQIIDNNYNSSYNFVMYTYPIHRIEKGADGSMSVGNTNIIENNPYVYLLRNVNFTDVENLYFQIRFSKTYIDKTSFKLGTDATMPVILNPKDNNGSYTYNENQYFVPGREFFSEDVIKFSDNTTSQEGFKLNDESYKGVYDILLIFNPSESSDDVDAFHIYAYRHMINFIKVYGIGTEIQTDADGLAIHTKDNGDPLDSQIWQGRANLGEYLDPSMYSSIPNSSGHVVTLQNALESYIRSYISSNPTYGSYDFSKFYLRDYVTDQIVMYYDTNTKSWVTNNYVLLKNYLFIVEVVS